MNILSVTAFVKRHYKPARNWPAAAILRWLEWFQADRRMCVVEDAGRVVGLGIARCVSDAETGKQQPYAHAEDAPVVFVDLTIAKAAGVMRGLWKAMRHRFGPRNHVAYERSVRGPDLHSWSFNHMEGHVYGR